MGSRAFSGVCQALGLVAPGFWQRSAQDACSMPAASACIHSLACSWHQTPTLPAVARQHLLPPRSFSTSPMQTNQPLSQQETSPAEQQQQQQQQQPDYRQIRARIFGEPIRPDERTGRRVLARPLQGAQLASWYFLPPRMPGSHSEEREYIMLRKLNKRQKKKAEEEAAAGTKKKK